MPARKHRLQPMRHPQRRSRRRTCRQRACRLRRPRVEVPRPHRCRQRQKCLNRAYVIPTTCLMPERRFPRAESCCPSHKFRYRAGFHLSQRLCRHSRAAFRRSPDCHFRHSLSRLPNRRRADRFHSLETSGQFHQSISRVDWAACPRKLPPPSVISPLLCRTLIGRHSTFKQLRLTLAWPPSDATARSTSAYSRPHAPRVRRCV
jgi:hypothetical protein